MLSVEGLSRKADDHWLWRDLSFTLHPGESLGLTGPTGAGKTLLLRTIAGLEEPGAGEIRFEERSTGDWYPPAFRARVLYFHQQPAFLEGSVEENLRAVFSFHLHHKKSFDRANMVRRLERLGKDASFLDKPAHRLSGGEGQLVAFLRGLQLEPTVLLLDEPTASLDPASTEHVEGLVAEWMAADPKRATIWTSHDPQQLARLTTATFHLAGRAT